MDPSKAVRVRKPRRTNSAPGSAFRAAHDRTIPNALRVALFGKKEACHSATFPTKTIASAATEAAADVAAPTALSVVDLSTSHGPAGEGSPSVKIAVTPTILLQDADMQDILDQMNESTTDGAGRESNSSGRNSSNAVEREESPDGSSGGGGAAQRKPGPNASQPSSQLSEDDEGEFDVDEMRYLFNKLRETTGYCSDKISHFVQHLWEELGQGDTGLLLLGRESMAAPAAHVDRKRRLFGEKEPELHQRVLGVLNKVTDDKSKYREIKNELMRLPLPEADPASLEQVVKCFFAKAVREQRFSSHYADLVEEICRIPPNQIQLGDKKESLSYRLRVALLCRCQEEFSHHRSMATLISEASNPSMSNDELEALRASEKMKLCGNVKFVGELFLRKIVSARIIQLILVMLLCGESNPAALNQPLPPPYIPEADECDQLITLLMTTGAAFSKTDIGVQTLDPALRVIDYFSRHHPVQRTRFVLLDLLDAAARRFTKKVHGAPKAPATAASPVVEHQTPSSATTSHVHNRFGPGPSTFGGAHDAPPPAKVGITIARRVIPPPTSEATPQRAVPPALSAETPPPSGRSLPSSAMKGSTPASPMSQPSSTPKARQPIAGATMTRTGSGMIPAPRSATGMSPVTPRVGLGGGDATTQQRGASISPPPAYANVQKIPATVELIGPMMTTLVTSSDYAAMAAEVAGTFSSIRVAMDVWVQRSLGLIKAEQERSQIAPLMIALKDHGATREELRSTALQALLRCVDAQLHEGGFRLWKYWAQVVAGDKKGIVLDDNLHNEAYSRILEATLDEEAKAVDKSIARAFIVDVLQVDVANGNVCSARFTDVHATYTRFRPLNVLTNVCATLAKQHQQPQQPLRGSAAATNPPVVAVLDIIACPPIVKLQDVELTTYLALLKGKPTRDELREFFRMEKNMSNPYTPAKVLSAIYHAEYAGQARAFLDESLDLLMFVIDYANRSLRELALVLELYHSWKGITAFQRPMTEGQRWMSRLKLNAVVTDETHTRVHRLLESDRDAEIAIGPSKEVTHGQSHHHHGANHHPQSHGHHHHNVRSIQH